MRFFGVGFLGAFFDQIIIFSKFCEVNVNFNMLDGSKLMPSKTLRPSFGAPKLTRWGLILQPFLSTYLQENSNVTVFITLLNFKISKKQGKLFSYE